MNSRILTIIIVLIVGYFVGVKFPGFAARLGI